MADCCSGGGAVVNRASRDMMAYETCETYETCATCGTMLAGNC